MGEPEKPKEEYPPSWVRQRHLLALILYGPLLVGLGVWFLVRFLMTY